MTKLVAVWKRTWLPFSETFIRDQIQALPAPWKAVRLGFHTLPDAIMNADYAPYPMTAVSKVLRATARTKPFRRQYTKLIQESECGLVHAHFGTGGVEALPLARSTGLPLITTFHGSDTTTRSSVVPGAERLYRWELGNVFKYSSALIAVSKHLADRLIAAGAPPKKIEVIYTGTVTRPQLAATDPAGVVFVGRLIDIKGVDHLLHASAKLRERYRIRVPVTIVGDGPRRRHLEDLAQKLQVDATFLGRLSSDQVPEVVAQNKIFCGPSLPSRRGTREGFGMVYVEAALQGVPSVAYASGGVKEAVEDGVSGLLAPEGNVDALTDALATLLNNETYRLSLGMAARENALKLFNLEVNVAKLVSVYDGIA